MNRGERGQRKEGEGGRNCGRKAGRESMAWGI